MPHDCDRVFGTYRVSSAGTSGRQAGSANNHTTALTLIRTDMAPRSLGLAGHPRGTIHLGCESRLRSSPLNVKISVFLPLAPSGPFIS
jgi:hypothetical protein